MKPDRLFNLLSLLFLVLTACMGLYVLIVFAAPTSGLNPFPPVELPVDASLPLEQKLAATPTASDTPTSAVPTFPPEWTATFTPAASDSPSPTPTATETPVPTATLEALSSSELASSPTPTASAASPARPSATNRPAGGYPGQASATPEPPTPTATSRPAYP